MVDYAAINEAMERTRLEVRRHLMAEGAAAERARIVAMLQSLLSESREINQRSILALVIGLIERGDRAQPEPENLPCPK